MLIWSAPDHYKPQLVHKGMKFKAYREAACLRWWSCKTVGRTNAVHPWELHRATLSLNSHSNALCRHLEALLLVVLLVMAGSTRAGSKGAMTCLCRSSGTGA